MGSKSKVKAGIIGCGNISSIYLSNSKTFRDFEVTTVADLIPERAKAKAAEFGIARACRVKELLADPEIEIVANLTIPKAHASVAMAALRAGKSVYNEKPLAIRYEDARKMLKLAKSRGLRVGCAPDTFLGAGGQTCRKLIDDGTIGKPIAASAFMECHGHESWHPDPEFYYKVGGGPMFDMGPYYLTALVNLMGPISRVTGSGKITFPTRTITSKPKHGQKMVVTTPTHIVGVMDFASGAVGTITTSFDVWRGTSERIVIYGTEGTLVVPDPNSFGGRVSVIRFDEKDWREVPLTHGYADNSRGVGIADMANAIRSGRAHRASGELAAHVLETMESFLKASRQGRHIRLKSTCKRPAPFPIGLGKGEVHK